MIHQHITTTEIFHSALPKFNIQHGWKPSSPTPHHSLTTLHRNNQSRAAQLNPICEIQKGPGASFSHHHDEKWNPAAFWLNKTSVWFRRLCSCFCVWKLWIFYLLACVLRLSPSFGVRFMYVWGFHLFQNRRNSFPEGQTEEERNPGQTWSNHPLQRYNRTNEWRWMSALLLQLNTSDFLKHLQSFHRLQTTAWNCSQQNGEFKQKDVFQAVGGASGSSKD